MDERIVLVIKIMWFSLRFPLRVNYNLSLTANHVDISNLKICEKIEYLNEYGFVDTYTAANQVVFKKATFTKESTRHKFRRIVKSGDRSNSLTSLSDFNEYRLARDFPLSKKFNELKKSKNDEIESDDGGAVNLPALKNYFDQADFFISDYYYLILKIFRLFNVGKYSITFDYTEFEYMPLFLQVFFHIPLILTALIIIVVVLTFDPEINKNLINNEINKLPIRKYTKDYGFHECSVCLDEFVEGVDIRVLNCNHFFHKGCIDSWLINSLKCPICRKSVSNFADTPSYEMYQNYYFV